MAASPAPRKIALIMNSITTVTLHASMMRVNHTPCSMTDVDAPISRSSFGASGAPASATAIATIKTGAGPEAIAAAKALIPKVWNNLAQDATNFTAEAIAARRVSAEGQEGMTAFMKKGKASWNPG